MDWFTLLPFEIALGLFLGYFIAKRSQETKPIKGGLPAQIFHYLGASAFIATAPTVLISAFVLRYGLLRNILIGVIALGLAFVFLMLYAAFESRAAAQAELR